MSITADSKRAISILMNLAAGLDEHGRPNSDGSIKLTQNVRLSAASGAALLATYQGVPLERERSQDRKKFNADRPLPDFVVQEQTHWLDRLKAAKGLVADAGLAEYLQVSTSRFSLWRTGKEVLPLEIAWRLGLELDIDPLLVIGSVHYHAAAPDRKDAVLRLLATFVPDPVRQDKHSAASAPGLEAHGMPWSSEEDPRLLQAFRDGRQIAEIAATHTRTARAILYRLFNHHKELSAAQMAAQAKQHGFEFSE